MLFQLFSLFVFIFGQDEETRKNKGPRGFSAKNRQNSILTNSAPRFVVVLQIALLAITVLKSDTGCLTNFELTS